MASYFKMDGRFPKDGFIDKKFLEYQDVNLSLEEVYFWIVDALRNGGWKLDKINDYNSSSIHSTMGGASASKLSINQEKAMQYLKFIADMVKSLFQIVRELRVIDERMDLYERSKEGDHAAEVTLRGYWVDMVEGGSKNPSSVYGLSRDVGFTTLPDLFFSSPAMKQEDVEKEVSKLEFNDSLKNVLKRKLSQFMTWKERTYNEIMQRRGFTLHYLKQHYATIKLYIDWVKPYLRNVKRLWQDESKQDSVDIVNSFETGVIEIEVMASQPSKSHYTPVVIYHFYYRIKPMMSFTDQSYQHRGPVHVGRVTIKPRGYVWTDRDIYEYKRMRREEDFEILGQIDETVKEAVNALGDKFLDYLEEMKLDTSEFKKKEEKSESKPAQQKRQSSDPFLSVGKGFVDLFGALVPGVSGTFSSPKKSKDAEMTCPTCKTKNKPDAYNCKKCGTELREPDYKEKLARSKSKKAAKGAVLGGMFGIYKNFKKAHGMIQW